MTDSLIQERARAVPAKSGCVGEIDRHERLSPRDFFHEYYKKKQPVIIAGLTDAWPARRLWTFDFFRRNYGDDVVTCGRWFDKSVRMKMSEYLDYLEAYSAGRIDEPHRSPLYLEGWYFRRAHPELHEHYELLRPYANDLFDRWFPHKWDPKATGILIGPKNTFTKLHYDLMSTHSWNAQIVGKKRWVLVSPDQVGDLYLETRQGPGYHPGTDVDAPDLEKYPKLGNVRWITGDVHEGETIFFPQRWFHQVTALEDSISLTHNYMSPNNMVTVSKAYLLNRAGKKNM